MLIRKIGAVDDFTAATEAELRMFNPLITDFMIVVKRGQAGSFGDLDLTFEVVENF